MSRLSGTRTGEDGARGAVPAQIFLRPIATPLPVGLIALATGSFVLSGLQLKWLSSTQAHPIALCLLGFVVPLQAISLAFGFLGRDEGAASGLGVLLGSWLVTGLVMITSVPGSASGALGLLLLAAGAALLVPVSVAVSSKPLVSIIFLTAAARFVLTGVYELGQGSHWQTVSGEVGLAVAALALYGAAAFALETAHRRAVLPTLRISGESSPAPQRSDDPVGPVDHDAGVRSQL